MPRNVELQILRGTLAHMPSLNSGELYYATDTGELYVGPSPASRVGVSSVVKTGTGNVAAQSPSTVSGGPANPRKPTAFVKVNIGGTVWWMPLFQ